MEMSFELLLTFVSITTMWGAVGWIRDEINIKF